MAQNHTFNPEISVSQLEKLPKEMCHFLTEYDKPSFDGEFNPNNRKTEIRSSYNFAELRINTKLEEEILKECYQLQHEMFIDYYNYAVEEEDLEKIAVMKNHVNSKHFNFQESDLKDKDIENIILQKPLEYLSLDDKYFKSLYNDSGTKQLIMKIYPNPDTYEDFTKLNLKCLARRFEYAGNDIVERTIKNIAIEESVLVEKDIDDLAYFRNVIDIGNIKIGTDKIDEIMMQKTLKPFENRFFFVKGKLNLTKTKPLMSPPSKRKEIEGIFNEITVFEGSFNQQNPNQESFEDTSKHSKYIKPIYRHKKPYSTEDDKIAQLMRHIARLLYYKWKLLDNKLQAVQVMLVEERKLEELVKISIYISYNSSSSTNQKIAIYENVYDLMTKSVLPKHLERQENRIQKKFHPETKRTFVHSKKHLERIAGKTDNSEVIKKVIAEIKKEKTDLVKLIFPGDKDKHHAEELLCDKANELAKDGTRFRIYGKKRPCMSCFARIKASKIDFFNKRPGLVWWNCVTTKLNKKDGADIDGVIETIKVLLTTPSYITFSADIKSGRSYDTDSESESEE